MEKRTHDKSTLALADVAGEYEEAMKSFPVQWLGNLVGSYRSFRSAGPT